jgi:hypothetical protein
MNNFSSWLVAAAMSVLILLPHISGSQTTQASKPRWFRGNTHTHTLRSDGDSTPEEVTKWYQDNGYNFLFITDHETITPVEELNTTFGKPGEFVVFPGQEVTDRLDGKPYHVNGLGVRRVTMPKRGKTVVENLQSNIDSVRASGGIPQINHPNFGWALNADQIIQVKNIKLMELFNGHPLVNNLGGGGSPSVEAIWDSVLSSGKLIYGIASDDVHSVRKLGDRKVPTPGHGWVMVRAPKLAEKAILEALERGDFYSSTGVELEDYRSDGRSITITIKPERWSKYRIQFIGVGGKILAESLENSAAYSFKGNEGYVRARVIESNGKIAWTQPVMITK